MKVILVIWLLSSSSSGWREERYVMPDMQTCWAAIERAKVEIPVGRGAESAVTMVCAQE